MSILHKVEILNSLDLSDKEYLNLSNKGILPRLSWSKSSKAFYYDKYKMRSYLKKNKKSEIYLSLFDSAFVK